MKILAIGRNYVDHIEELNNEVPTSPVVFFKPETAVLKKNEPFYYPSFSKNIHHEVEVLLKICKTGKNVSEKFAHKYYDEIGIGIDFTARDLQTEAKEKGLPWTLAKGFNGSAPISHFLHKSKFENLNDLDFSLEIDGRKVQEGNTKLMIYSFDYIVSYISSFITLKKGDIIFTGTPKGVGPVEIGNTLKAYLNNEKLLDFEVK